MIGNVDLDLLEKTYQNANMGIVALKSVIDKSTDEEFKNAINRQLMDYHKIADRSKEELVKSGAETKDNPALEKLMLKGNVRMNTMVNSSRSHIAQMIIRGSTMGITQMTKLLNSKPEADGSSTQIAKEFIHLEQDNIDKMKKFL